MLQDLLQSKTSLFSDNAQSVLRAQENRARRVVLLKGNLVGNIRSEKRGVNAHVRMNGVSGFASTAEYSEQAVEAVLQTASKNASFLHQHAPAALPPYPPVKGGTVTQSTQILDCAQERILSACRQIDEYIVSHYPALSSRTVIYTEDSQEKIIYASSGASGHVVTPRCYIYVILNTENSAGVPVELLRVFGGAGCFTDRFADVRWMYEEIDKLYRQLMEKKEGIYPQAGLKTVVLGGIMTGMLAHEAVGHTVEADLVLGGSVAGHLLGQTVASEQISLVDFAHTAFGEAAPLPVYLDDEGVRATDAVLIENGILKGYMHNRASAQHFGVRPCGNARAWEFSDEPLIRMRNTAILPGKSKLEDMIASVDDGYYLINSGNGQADLTGEFMFGVTMGYEIKNGKLGRALLDTTVSGVAFEMLKTVDMVSDSVVWSSSGFCGKKQRIPVSLGGPALRCKMLIGGR